MTNEHSGAACTRGTVGSRHNTVKRGNFDNGGNIDNNVPIHILHQILCKNRSYKMISVLDLLQAVLKLLGIKKVNGMMVSGEQHITGTLIFPIFSTQNTRYQVRAKSLIKFCEKL